MRSHWKKLAELLFMASCILGLMFAIGACLLLLNGSGSEHRDFVSYWAAGQQLVHHQNPYDSTAILRLEHSVGFPLKNQSLIVRNPPSALLLVVPLGFVGFRAAALIWSLLILTCWIVSIRLLCRMQKVAKRDLKALGYSFNPRIVALLFAPTLVCVLAGQTALFALLGICLFFRLYQSHPFSAGLSLWLCVLKPHLLLPFAAVLVLWTIVTRRYAILAGVIVSIVTSLAAAHYVDPSAWLQYSQMMRTVGIEREFIPCLSIALRFVFNSKLIWLQYVPATAGILWAAWYFWYRRDRWDWLQHGPLLVLISLLVSPYGWLTDQVLALPALLFIAYRVSFRSLLILALASSAIEIGILSNISMHSAFYLWTAPAWLAWYLYATRGASEAALANSRNNNQLAQSQA